LIQKHLRISQVKRFFTATIFRESGIANAMNIQANSELQATFFDFAS